MYSRKILLFGGSGMLGTRIRDLLSSEYDIDAPKRINVDLTVKKMVESFIAEKMPNVIVYAAGIASQVSAEQNKSLAKQLNAISAGWVAKSARQNGIPVIYFSTDAVFKGDKRDRPYTEEDRIQPVNYYGLTKAKGEENVLSQSSKNTVIRVESLYTAVFQKKTDFVRNMCESFQKHKEVIGIEDQVFTPTFNDNAVQALKKVVDLNLSGIFHVASKDAILNCKFVELVANEFGFSQGLIKKVKFKDYFNDGIKRGQYCWLDTSKANKTFGKEIIVENNESIKRFALQLIKNA